jgi:hypothetical protein
MVSKSQTEPNWWAKNMSYRPTLAGEPLQHIDVGNTAGFVTSAALQPASFQARVFPRRIGSCRADGLNRLDANIQRTFRIHEGITFQLRMDALDALNRSQLDVPSLSPTSTDFGKVTNNTSSTNRFLLIQGRIHF